MNLITSVIALTIIIVIASVNYLHKTNSEGLENVSENEIVVETKTEKATDSSTPIPTNLPTITSTPTIIPTQLVLDNDLSYFKYPNSSILQSEENKLILQSSDSTDAITNWYEEKIKSQNLNTKSFVKTKTNDKVLNKLVATDSDREISVEITKEENTASVNIIVILN